MDSESIQGISRESEDQNQSLLKRGKILNGMRQMLLQSCTRRFDSLKRKNALISSVIKVSSFIDMMKTYYLASCLGPAMSSSPQV